MISTLASGARGPTPRFDPHEEKFQCLNTLSLVSFAGMTLNKCAVLWFGTLTGCPLRRKSPAVQVKEPYSNLDMVTCRLSSCNPECTKYIPANNALRDNIYIDRGWSSRFQDISAPSKLCPQQTQPLTQCDGQAEMAGWAGLYTKKCLRIF